MVIAWRIMLMTLLGRACPELPADVLFSDIELEVLSAHAVKKETLPRPHNWDRPYDLSPPLVDTLDGGEMHRQDIRSCGSDMPAFNFCALDSCWPGE
jgi:hypothetical protein